jgi:hypothetical protein
MAAVGQPGSLHCWTPLRPGRGACVLQNPCAWWSRAQPGKLHRGRFFLGRRDLLFCHVLESFVRFAQQRFALLALGSAGVARCPLRLRLLLLGRATQGLVVA